MRYDVVVVGAGPAGSTASKFLSENGIKTLLIDKSHFPRDKPCGGGLTAKVLEKFEYINDDLIDAYSYGGFLYSKSLNQLKIHSDKPIIAMVRRKTFDNELLKIAEKTGTKFLGDTKITDITIETDGVTLFGEDGFTVSSNFVIGADGVWSVIAEKTGLRTNICSFGLSLYNEYRLGEKAINTYFSKERFCHLHLKFGGIPGYGWVFPKKEHVNIGIGVADASVFKKNFSFSLKEVYLNYFNILKKRGILPKDLKIGKVKGGTLPYHPLHKTFTSRVLLCGDAAGLTNPLTGEGIDYAMYSGKIAASVLIEAFEKNKTSEKYLSKYQKRWKQQFGKDIELFFKGSKQWKKDNEKYFSIMKKDKKISDLFLQITTGNKSISKIKWKLIRRFLYLRLTDLFS